MQREQEEETMQARTQTGWMIVVGGIVGALLWAGIVGARPFPGGLPACRVVLKTCTANLDSCTTDLDSCTTDLDSCATDLDVCTTDLGGCSADLTQAQADLETCTANLTTCQADLAACQPQPMVVPGDGVTGPALSYRDNGDGTITDLTTGLMWEQKTGTIGIPDAAACLTALHGVSSTCTGSQAAGAWINAVNTEGGTGYAGYRDWRLPTVHELQSLVDYRSGILAIDPTFSPTSGLPYYSSTLSAGPGGGRWHVFFALYGFVSSDNSNSSYAVRAVRDGGGPRYQDNGDGTITDLKTGLMWEQKTGTVAGGNAAACLTALHDVNSTCTWAQATGDWINAVNAEGYAGYHDWRLPTVKELLSIVNYEAFDPVIDPMFSGHTALLDGYWSSTPFNFSIAPHAWIVSFFSGSPTRITTDSSLPYVRAVRGGQ
jgi:hypothetical protein